MIFHLNRRWPCPHHEHRGNQSSIHHSTSLSGRHDAAPRKYYKSQILRRQVIALLVIVFCRGVASSALQADEFTALPSGDPAHAQLATLRRAGWLNGNRSSISLTRYEAALETAKALFTAGALAEADPDWLATAPRPALQALRTLTQVFRAELLSLDVDLNSFVVLWKPARVRSSTPALPRPSESAALFATPAHPASPRRLTLPLAQRLRVNLAVQSLAEADRDPLPASRLGAPLEMEASAHLNVTRWLSIRAGTARQSAGPRAGLGLDPDRMRRQPLSLRQMLHPRVREVQSAGGGLDLRPLRNLTVSGEIARLGLRGQENTFSTRYAGAIGLNGWQNRISLQANLQRLIPEDSLALASTAAEFNVAVDVTDRLTLQLLYQHLFGPTDAQRADRVAGAGLNINF